MKKIKLLLLASILMMGSTIVVNAEETCQVSGGNLTQDAINTCRIVTLSGNVEVAAGVTVEINNKIVILEKNATLTVNGILNLKDFKPETEDLSKVQTARSGENYTNVDSTNFIFEDGSKLVVKGTVNSTNEADNACEGTSGVNACPIAFQTRKGGTFGEIEVIGGTLKIDGFKRGGIAPVQSITAKENGTLDFTNNGYGSNSAPITLEDGNIIAKNNDIGFTSKLTASGNSTVTATENRIIGAVLNDSTIGGNTQVNITGNNTSHNEKRGTDLAINANNGVQLNESATLTVGDIRTYFKDEMNGLGGGTKNEINVNGSAATFSYENVIEDEVATSNGKATSYKPTTGFVRNNNTITAYGTVDGEIEISEGETFVVSENANVEDLTVTAEAGAIITNNSESDLTVITPNGKITISKEDNEVVIADKEAEVTNPNTRDTLLNSIYLFAIACLGMISLLVFKKRYSK